MSRSERRQEAHRADQRGTHPRERGVSRSEGRQEGHRADEYGTLWRVRGADERGADAHAGGSADVLAELELGQAAERGELTERKIVLCAEFLGQGQALIGVEPAGVVLAKE